jgi:hypothetical protein
MKKIKTSKLNLNSQTIRALTDSQLGKAAGGVPPTSHIGGSFCCTDNNLCVTAVTCVTCVTFCDSACGTCIWC